MTGPPASGGAGEPLAGAELVRIRFPLHRGHRAAHGRLDERELVLVRVEMADGTVGWGECSALASPTYSSEYTDGAWAVLRDLLLPAALRGELPALVGHPMATAALTTAITDAALRRVGRSLAFELASQRGDGTPQEALPVCAVVSRTLGIDDLVAGVAERIEGRVAMVKLKASPAGDDLAAVAEVRQTWPDLALAVDFNGTADAEALGRLEPLGLAYVEQPASADALVQSAAFAGSLGTPIALDESLGSVGALDAAVALRSGSIANIKPARFGSPHAAAAAVRRAVDAGWKVFVGGMLESGIGRAAALAVAALPELSPAGSGLPTDLGPSLAYVDRDITDPLQTDELGRIEVPDGTGIGRTPDPASLALRVVDRLEVAR